MADTDAPGGGATPAALHAETPPAVGEMPLANDAPPNLQSSLFTLSEQSMFNRDRTRIAAALSALDSAQKGLDLYRKKAAFVKPLLDAFAGFEAQSQAANATILPAPRHSCPRPAPTSKGHRPYTATCRSRAVDAGA